MRRFCVRVRFSAVFLLVATAVATPAPAAPRQLTIVGTGDSQQLLRQLGKSFEKGRPGTEVVIPESIGSSGGLKAVLRGEQVMARTARELTDAEAAAGLISRTFAVTPVVFAVHPDVQGVASLTAAQCVALFNGAITDWARVGGPRRKVYLVNREPGDSSRTAIARAIPSFAAAAAHRENTFYNTPDAMAALAKFPDTIGYGPLAMLAGVPVRPLAFEGVAPTAENVRLGRYPLWTRLQLVWKEPLPPAYREFLEFIASVEGRRIMKEFGVLPVGDAGGEP